VLLKLAIDVWLELALAELSFVALSVVVFVVVVVVVAANPSGS
jgi:hypothetical protein